MPPQMPAPAIAPIELLRVLRMRPPDESGERIATPWQSDQMHVIGHPAPAQQRSSAGFELLEQDILVAAPVFVVQEDLLAVIAALSDVMRHAHRHHSRLARHLNRRCIV